MEGRFSGARKQGADILVPLLFFIAAVAIRALPWNHVFAGGNVYLYDPDCYIRVRKVLVYLNVFPHTFVHDYFQGFPAGTGVISPPVMEYLIAGLLFPFRGFAQLTSWLPHFAALVPPVVGGVTVLLLFRLVNSVFGLVPAIAASLVLVVSPPHIDATVLGRFDNEMAEPLLLLLVFSSYAKTYGSVRNRRAWAIAGVLSVVYLSVWRGALFPLAIIGFDLLARVCVVGRSSEDGRAIAGNAALMYLLMAALVSFVCLADIGGAGPLFAYNIISWFHVALFGGAALLFGACGWFVTARSYPAPVRALTGGAVIIALAMIAAAVGNNLLAGVDVLGSGSPWLNSIEQYQRGVGLPALRFYGMPVVLAPFLLLLFRNPVFRDFPWKRFLSIGTLVFFAAAILRQRYGMYCSLYAAILIGAAAYAFREHVRERGKTFAMRQAGIGIAALALLAAPSGAYCRGLFNAGAGFSIRGDIEETLVWIRDHTPPAGDPYRPSSKPAYGVLARWDYSGWIESVALRPSVTTAFGTEAYGMEEAARFFLASDEDEMDAVLRRNGVRYLIVDKMMGDLGMYAGLIGDQRRLLERSWDANRGDYVTLPTAEAFSLVVSRLFFADGAARSAGPVTFRPVEGLQLVYESSSQANVFGFPWEIKKIKVFEYCRGASLVVNGRPGERVAVSQEIETNQGRRFTNVQEKVVGKEGSVLFRVAYAVKNAPGTTGATGPAAVLHRSKRYEVLFTDEDIERGGTVTLRVAPLPASVIPSTGG